MGTLTVCCLTDLAISLKWSLREDLNPTPAAYKAAALPDELRRQKMEEGGGVQPLRVTAPWGSNPVAKHLAAPSVNGRPHSRIERDSQ